MSSVTSHAQPSAVLNATILTGCKYAPLRNIFDDNGLVSFGFVGLDISAAQRPKVVQHHMDGDIKWLTEG